MQDSTHIKGVSRTKRFLAWLFLGKRLYLSDKRKLSCPRCGTRMDKLEKEGVVIDVCPQCNGLFLDDGEIEKLVKLGQERKNNNFNNWNKHDKVKHTAKKEGLSSK